MAVPNMLAHVESCKAKFPEAWKNAHTGNPNTEDFVRLVAADCHAADPRFGLNGKRGNPNDISDDCLNFIGAGPGKTPDGVPCTVIDFIQAAGSPDAKPVWNPQSDPEGSSGAWVAPASVDPIPGDDPGNSGSTPGKPIEFPPRDLELEALLTLDVRYQEGGRENRAKENLEPIHIDNEGIAVWFGDYLRRYATGDHAPTSNDPRARSEAALDAVLKDIDAAWPKPKTD